MMKQIKITLFVLTALVTYSCSPAYYSPSTMNLPSLEKKGDLQVSANSYVSRSDNVTILDSEGYDFNVAYSPIDKMAITAGFSDFVNTNINASIGTDHNNLRMGNLGVGYYTPLNDRLSWETYLDGHFGQFKGTVTSEENNFLNRVSANTHKIGIKSGIAIKGKYTSCLVGLGLYNLNYSNIEGHAIDEISYLRTYSSSIVREFSVTLRVGTEKIKGQYQIGRSDNKTNPNFLQTNSYQSLGLLINLNLLEDIK